MERSGLLHHTVALSDLEILTYVRKFDPKVVVIDAPLSLPKGRLSLEVKSDIHFRECDRELLRRRIRFFPITLGPMRKLTKRGIQLANVIRSEGFEVFEGYPGAAQDILGVPRKNAGINSLMDGLRRYGLNFRKSATHDELDAITCAYVGMLYFDSKTELIGEQDEGQILLPLLTRVKRPEKSIISIG